MIRAGLRSLGGESLVYGVGAALSRGVQVLLLPVLTRALSPDAYGVGELVITYLQTVVLVLVFGMDGALARFFYEPEGREARIRMASSSLAFRMALGTGVAALAALAAAPLAAALMGGEAYRKYLLAGAATLPFTLLVLFGSDVLRVTLQPAKFVVLNVANTLLVAGLSILFVVRLDAGVIGMLYGRLLADLLSALLALVLIRHAIAFRFDRAALAKMLRYGGPAVPAAIAFAAITAMDRYVLQRVRTLEEVGIYAVAVKFFALVLLVVAPFQMAYGPWAYSRAAAPEAPRLFARALGLYVGIASLVALAASLFAPEVLAVLVPAAYRGAAAAAPWLAFAAVAFGAYTVASVGIGLALRTDLLVVCAGGAALAALAANLTLVPGFGIHGAGAATAAGYVVAAALTYAIAQRVRPLPYRGARLAAIFALGLGLGVAVPALAPGGIAGLAIKVGVLAGYGTVLFAAGVARDRGAVAARARPA